jgi:hypothetical protein
MLLNSFWFEAIIPPVGNNIPTKEMISTMDWCYNGESFVQVPSMVSIELSGIDYAYLTEPFFGNTYNKAATKKKLCGMDWVCAGEPFVQISSKPTLHLSGLDFGINAEPFFGEE